MNVRGRSRHIRWRVVGTLCVALLSVFAIAACGNSAAKKAAEQADKSGYLNFVDVEPITVDPHCIIENYTVALNIFDRLVEVSEETGSQDGELVGSLADTWQRSDDGLTYTFHLRDNITCSNGEPLTASDVEYSFKRLLTHPDSCHADLVSAIAGAQRLRDGETDELEGFSCIDDQTFKVRLEQPSTAFLAGLATPGASILDEQTTEAAGDAFGREADVTIGTGPFVLENWDHGRHIEMRANFSCWAGPPDCAGLMMQFYSEANSLRELYAKGMIDLLDIDKLGMDAEYFLRDTDNLRNLVHGQRVGITYIALNESKKPLDDVRVRRALTLGLDRRAMLVATAGGRGTVEQGIFPRGLVGHNPQLAELPYDPEQARKLLSEAGLSDGFDLTISCSSSASQSVRDLLTLATSMWSQIGVRATVEELDASDFAAQRKAGELTCYTGTFSADYNDPQNFMDSFFADANVSRSRSLCYSDESTFERIQDARHIVNEKKRLQEYQDLERKIVHEDCAWIPLYSKMHYFVVSDCVEGFQLRWNGWSSNRYDKVRVVRNEV